MNKHISKMIAVILTAFMLALFAAPTTTMAAGDIPHGPWRVGHIPLQPVEGISTSPGGPWQLGSIPTGYRRC